MIHLMTDTKAVNAVRGNVAGSIILDLYNDAPKVLSSATKVFNQPALD